MEASLGLILVLLTAALCGVAATAVVIIFITSCWSFGSLVLFRSRGGDISIGVVTTAVGWAFFAILFSVLAAIPYNTVATHALIVATPIIVALAKPSLRVQFGSHLAGIIRPSRSKLDITYLSGLVVLVVIFSFHLAMVSLPERFHDAMVMHLYIPSFIAAHRAWSYDASMYAFAYMPIGGDMLYTHMFLLQGEAAARLLNFAAFAFACLATYRITVIACSPAVAVWAVALLASLPLALIESTSLFVENTVAMFIVCAALVIVSRRFNVRLIDYVAILILVAGASIVKLHGLFAAVLLGGIGAILYVRQAVPSPRWIKLTIITAAGSAAALWPYLLAWIKTGNPLFPFFNDIFKSRFFPPVEFVDARWVGKLSYSLLYDMTFATSDFLEGWNGALGFSFLVFLAAGIAAALIHRNRIALFCGSIGLLIIAFLVTKTQYLRYLVIFFPLLTVVVAFAMEHLRKIEYMRIPLAVLVTATLLLNVYKMPAAGWIIGISDLRACCDEELRRQIELGQTPERVVNRIINEVAGPMARVFYVGHPFGALLSGTAIYANWYNTREAESLAAVKTDEQFRELMARIAPSHVVMTTNDTSQLAKLASHYVQTHGKLVTQVGPLMLYRM